MAFRFNNAEHYAYFVSKIFRENYKLVVSKRQKLKLIEYYNFCELYGLLDCFKFSYDLKFTNTFEFKNISLTKEMFNPKMTEECLKNNNCGIYFFLDEDYQYLYIGKSKSLNNRIVSSFKERSKHNKLTYIKFMFMEYHNAHFLEPYLILKYKPYLNTDFIVDYDYTLIDIDYPFAFSETFALAHDNYLINFDWENFNDYFEGDL